MNSEELIRGPLVVSGISSPDSFGKGRASGSNEKRFVGVGRVMQCELEEQKDHA